LPQNAKFSAHSPFSLSAVHHVHFAQSGVTTPSVAYRTFIWQSSHSPSPLVFLHPNGPVFIYSIVETWQSVFSKRSSLSVPRHTFPGGGLSFHCTECQKLVVILGLLASLHNSPIPPWDRPPCLPLGGRLLSGAALLKALLRNYVWRGGMTLWISFPPSVYPDLIPPPYWKLCRSLVTSFVPPLHLPGTCLT